MDLKALIEWCLDLRYFHPDDALDGGVAIPYTWTPGDDQSRLVLVLGENAGGKSFFRRIVRLATDYGKVRTQWVRPGESVQITEREPGPYPVREVIHLSMQARSGGDFMHGPMRAMVYGDESYNATGDLSGNLVKTGISTARDRDHDIIVYWDEPDIGMSAGAAAGAGLDIGDLLAAPPDHLQAVFITSHSPPLVNALLGGLRPHYLYLGNADGPATPEAWIEGQRAGFEPVRPAELADRSRARFKAIQAILNDKKKAAKT